MEIELKELNKDFIKKFKQNQRFKFVCVKCGKTEVLARDSFKKRNELLCKDCQKRQSLSHVNWDDVVKKTKKTKLEKYGDENYSNYEKMAKTQKKMWEDEETRNKLLKSRQQKSLEKYGTTHHMKNKDFCDNFFEEYEERTGYKTPLTSPKALDNLNKKYNTNVTNAFQIEEVKEKIKKTKEERHGDSNYNNIEKARKTNLEKYGVEASWANHDVRLKARKKYFYDNKNFDSSWELSVYMYLKENNVDFEYQPDVYFEYEARNKVRRYYPDFRIENTYYEIKGEQFYDKENDTFVNPYNNEENDIYNAKHDCLIRNNVKILFYEDIKDIIEKYKTECANHRKEM